MFRRKIPNWRGRRPWTHFVPHAASFAAACLAFQLAPARAPWGFSGSSESAFRLAPFTAWPSSDSGWLWTLFVGAVIARWALHAFGVSPWAVACGLVTAATLPRGQVLAAFPEFLLAGAALSLGLVTPRAGRISSRGDALFGAFACACLLGDLSATLTAPALTPRTTTGNRRASAVAWVASALAGIGARLALGISGWSLIAASLLGTRLLAPTYVQALGLVSLPPPLAFLREGFQGLEFARECGIGILGLLLATGRGGNRQAAARGWLLLLLSCFSWLYWIPFQLLGLREVLGFLGAAGPALRNRIRAIPVGLAVVLVTAFQLEARQKDVRQWRLGKEEVSEILRATDAVASRPIIPCTPRLADWIGAAGGRLAFSVPDWRPGSIELGSEGGSHAFQDTSSAARRIVEMVRRVPDSLVFCSSEAAGLAARLEVHPTLRRLLRSERFFVFDRPENPLPASTHVEKPPSHAPLQQPIPEEIDRRGNRDEE